MHGKGLVPEAGIWQRYPRCILSYSLSLPVTPECHLTGQGPAFTALLSLYVSGSTFLREFPAQSRPTSCLYAFLLQPAHACPIENRVTYRCEQPSPQILNDNCWQRLEGFSKVRNGLRRGT